MELFKSDRLVATAVDEKSPEIDEVLRLIDEDGKHVGLWLGEYAKMPTKEKILKEINENRLIVARLDMNNKRAGYFLLIFFIGDPCFYVALEKPYREPEKTAEVLEAVFEGIEHVAGFVFDHFPIENRIWYFPTNAVAEAAHQVLVQAGFDLEEELEDIVDRSRQSAYTLTRHTFNVYHRGADPDAEEGQGEFEEI